MTDVGIVANVQGISFKAQVGWWHQYNKQLLLAATIYTVTHAVQFVSHQYNIHLLNTSTVCTVYTSVQHTLVKHQYCMYCIHTSTPYTHHTVAHCTLPYLKQPQTHKLHSTLAPHSASEAALPPSQWHRETCSAQLLLTPRPRTLDTRDIQQNPTHNKHSEQLRAIWPH